MASETGFQNETGSLFEEDFIFRTVGHDLLTYDHIALGELVANAWDAGATEVKIDVPVELDEGLSIEDDGCGLTAQMFRKRWMTLGYNRNKRQGKIAEFPPERKKLKRKAYGRNGEGRHGLFCFGNEYIVETWRDGTCNKYRVSLSSGAEAFKEKLITSEAKDGHGTKLTVIVTRRLPDAEEILDKLSTRFLQDPNFKIIVNGKFRAIEDLPSRLKEEEVRVNDDILLTISCVEGEVHRISRQSGVAFWVADRLVGEPSWQVGMKTLLDGRTKEGRELTFIVASDDLLDEVLSDWNGFKKTETMNRVYGAVCESVTRMLQDILRTRITEKRTEALRDNRRVLSALGSVDRREVKCIVEELTEANPLVSKESLDAVIAGVAKAKNKHDITKLIQRIIQMPEEDIAGLNRLLDEWSVEDALHVLDEIDKRIKVIEAIEKLESESVDELHVLHPLITSARWLFGPEYESSEFVSNISIRNAVNKVFRETKNSEDFSNPRKRPDLIILPDKTICAVGTEEIDIETNVPKLNKLLLIELKRGAFVVGKNEMYQADGYIDQIRGCGLLDGAPIIVAFVVGHSIDPKLSDRVRKVGENDSARIEVVTYGQLVRMGNSRLLRLRENIEERCPDSKEKLLEILSEPGDLPFS